MKSSGVLNVANSNRATMISANNNAARALPASAIDARQGRLSAIDRLTAALVHDLRNPLTAICGGAEMLLDANLDPTQARRVTLNIRSAAGRIQDLLADVSAVTRGQTKATESCNLRQILSEACEAAALADRNGIDILWDVPAGIQVPMQRARMGAVFLNLIANALEAMPHGGKIRIAAKETDDHVRVEAEDTGSGIPVEIRSRLFEPFVTAAKKEGLGLGLWVSRQTVRDHGGELWAEPAKGARFVMSLPLGVRRLLPAGGPGELANPHSRASGEKAPMSRGEA
jgi:signal transduction histidine kinase